ncbi:dTDP-4-dehydrorhamnose 3 5-epimerase-like protein [Sulfolobus islandicus L.S.2.15]|uniref:dTDP-4-dehydrorhamnose 3 5-epimerase-like protein n=1 Tax=Saccharolobus islandicus (strain L.S.2.15 / Lassen \|nr:dTDP-4-dehydrorhamnose 3 5-epimerase-like protein [Sulfolobus islandicus L.S.2.15]
MPFEFEELGLGVILIKPKAFPDNRGYFKEIFKESEFRKMNIPTPLQANVSFSKPGVVRGLHYQLPPKGGVLMQSSYSILNSKIIFD